MQKEKEKKKERKKSSKRHIYKMKREVGGEKETKSKAGASAGEEKRLQYFIGGGLGGEGGLKSINALRCDKTVHRVCQQAERRR